MYTYMLYLIKLCMFITRLQIEYIGSLEVEELTSMAG